MWFKDSIQVLREGECTATEAIADYINPESLECNRAVQVLTTILAKKVIKYGKVFWQPIASLVEVVLVDMMRPVISTYDDFTENEKLIIAAQIEAGIDNIDWSEMDPFRRLSLAHAPEITFSHKVIDNNLYHSNISIIPNYLN